MNLQPLNALIRFLLYVASLILIYLEQFPFSIFTVALYAILAESETDRLSRWYLLHQKSLTELNHALKSYLDSKNGNDVK